MRFFDVRTTERYPTIRVLRSSQHDELMTDHATVKRWVAGYELAWRTTRTDGLAALFTADATYLHSPYEQPVVGLHAIRQMWDEDRDGADEIFTLASDVLAVEGDTAVVRAEVQYGDPVRQEYRDLWILRLTDDGRCAWFEEWPYWPGRPYSAREHAHGITPGVS
jgi:ketosteroid isomerase-like protein